MPGSELIGKIGSYPLFPQNSIGLDKVGTIRPASAAAEAGLRLKTTVSGLAGDWRPCSQRVKVAFLKLLKFSVDDETGLDPEIQGGLVLKVERQRTEVFCGKELDSFEGGQAALSLALELFRL